MNQGFTLIFHKTFERGRERKSKNKGQREEIGEQEEGSDSRSKSEVKAEFVLN